MLFQLLAARGALVTSKLAFSQWGRIIKDPMTTAIDRLVHHCGTPELNVPSYCLEVSRRR